MKHARPEVICLLLQPPFSIIQGTEKILNMFIALELSIDGLTMNV